jgi:RNA polymerase sigma factor (sigma-70 family)
MPTLQEPSTDSRIERARQGCRSAMNYLLASIRTALRRRAKAGHNKAFERKEDISDLVQECQCQAAAQFGEFKGRTRAEYRSWIGTILDRVILQKQRFWTRKKRDGKREEPLAPDGGVLGELAGSTTSILGQLVRKEEWEQMMAAADWCREEDQAVFFRHLFEDQSYEEIAAEWDVSCQVVRQRFSRAFRRVREATRLQSLMTQYGFPPLQQEVIGVHRFQRLDEATIASRLRLPERLVADWLAEGRRLVRKFDEDKP